jgi:hypothetical protein
MAIIAFSREWNSDCGLVGSNTMQIVFGKGGGANLATLSASRLCSIDIRMVYGS